MTWKGAAGTEPKRAQVRELLANSVGLVAGLGLCALGPGFVKAGQLLSTRKDILPPEVCQGLARAVIGVRRHRGSIAEVSCYVDESGTAYAVKALRPRVRQHLRINLKTMTVMANLLARLPQMQGVPVREIVHDIADSVEHQTDMSRELQSLRRLRRALRPDEVEIPEPHPAQSTSDTLTMDWICSDPSWALASLDTAERERVLTLLVRSLLRMIFVEGFFHCDLHPGNWWPLPDGRIAIVDAGFTYEMTPEARWHFIEFFYGMAFGDGDHAFAHMYATALPGSELPDEQLAPFRGETIELVEAQYDASVDDFDLAQFGAKLFQLQRRHKFRGETAFVFPLIALLTIEGQLKEFAPNLNFQAIARKELGRPLLKLRAEFALH